MSATRTDMDAPEDLSLDDGQMEVLETVEAEPDRLLGTTIADRYRVDKKLGEGGMGAVYKGEHVLMQKAVAIKVLHREMTALDEVVRRFEREAVAAGRIDHPNVATATDFGKLPDGSFFLVLEFVPGKSLTDIMAAEGPLAEERALVITRQVASALSAAHGAGIVHRDLKPDNVMLIPKGTMELVKVLDFGIAKVDSAGGKALTRVGSVFGTPQYMSPEQAQGKTVDQRSDLYALGLLLYEMLAGRPTFESEEMVGLLTAQMVTTPDPLPASVSADVAGMVMRLLEKDPAKRHQTAVELMESIDALIGPVPSMPESGLMPPMSVRGVPRPVSGSNEVGAVTADRMAPIMRAITHPVIVKGRRFPLWAVAGAVLAIGALGVVILRDGEEPEPSAAAAPAAASDDTTTTDTELALVEVGNREAMKKVLAVAESDRTAPQWRALGRAYELMGDRKEALTAYRRAVTLEPKMAADKRLLRAVREGADQDATRDLALGMAADDLGERGADILFEVWSATSVKTPSTSAAKELLDTSKVRDHASAALSVALGLRDAKNCGDYKKLLGPAKESGDERSLRPLQKLTRDRGCGFLDLSDCYPCLRSDAALGEAIKAVQIRTAPRL